MKAVAIFVLIGWGAFSETLKIAETSASFLRIGVSTRGLAMADALSSCVDDASSIYYNPFCLSQNERSEITFVYTRWACDIYHTFIGAKRKNIGFGLIGLDPGSFEKRDEDGVLLPGRFQPYELAGIIGIGYPLSNNLSLGGAITLIQEKISGEITRTHSLNLGFLYKIKNIKTGISFKNIGGKIKGFPLPREIKGGISYLSKDIEEGLILSLELTIPEDSQGKISYGSEYQYGNMFLRMGYEHLFGRKGLTTLGFRGGFGIRIKGYEINYAFVPQGIFNTTSSISVSCKL